MTSLLDHESIQESVNQIIQKRLIQIPPSVREFLPLILSHSPVSWILLYFETYLLVVFLSDQDKQRVEDLIAKNYDPFPGLLTQDRSMPSVFRINSRNFIIKDSTAKNSY